MQEIIVLLVALVLLYDIAGASPYAAADDDDECQDYHFSYSMQWDWKNKCPDCGHNLQSPINIDTYRAITNIPSMRPLVMTGWCSPRSGSWSNNGHTLTFTPNWDQPPAYLDSPNHYRFKFLKFQFHWGLKDSGKGSEHTINSQAYDGEMQFLFKGEDAYGVMKHTALAVLLKSDHTSQAMFEKWQKLSNDVVYNSKVSIYNIVLDDYLPESKDYYVYAGSLTSPPCTENVQWIVLKHLMNVPEAFLDKMRSHKKDDGGFLKTNYRATQPLNARKLWSCYGGCYKKH
ncbi:PREDICTED: carbonic anhydrase 2-like [Amphimedon queenslandica]|uniref:carbonic anhydrase n=2 Tax=Amphimedon queenslandica TaxID=400682 RepID=A0AAN0IGY8_AMPQE|nr:PREDICTED: carbonic anhydrase 2-like [Amphimedon queenslandica]|eukprot:XP_003388987.1 PREDICTED: carbonic anhydrase 2-like [Amphimedon queenslandica]